MRHPDKVWSDPAYAQESLVDLLREYEHHLRGRAQRVSEATIVNYRNALRSFLRSLEHHGDPAVLGAITPHAANRWVTERRKASQSEDWTASSLSALKTFVRKFVWKELELTTTDLLEKVPRITPPERPMPKLTEEELEAILNCFDRGNFNDVRDQALVAVFLATGLRYRSVVQEMTVSGLDRVTGEFAVDIKGGREHLCKLSPRALKLVKRYLLRRGDPPTDRLWVTDEGRPFTYYGAQAIFRRIKARSGVHRVHAHLLRHTFAQVALEKGAPRAEVQDMLGHRTDAMTRRYAGTVRQQLAATNMARYGAV